MRTLSCLLTLVLYGDAAPVASPPSLRFGVLSRHDAAGGADVSAHMRSKKPKFKANMKVQGRARGPTNVGSDDDSNEFHPDQNISKISMCNDDFPAPDRAIVQCPEECPLMRFQPKKLCHWKCITERRCHRLEGVVDRADGYCYVCAVAGCHRCHSDKQVCIECAEGFSLKNGKCITTSASAWNVLIAVLVLILLIVLLYATHLALRPIVSPDALRWGERHRSRSKARRDDGNHELYALDMSLADEVTSAGGIGSMLHFSWQRMLLWWSITVTIAAMAVMAYHDRLNIREIFELVPVHDEAEGICSDKVEHQSIEAFEKMRIHVLYFTGLVYVGSSFGAILWAWWQRKKFQMHDDRTFGMADYALLCRGFPIELEKDRPGDLSVKLEEEYKQFFKSAWGDSVIGVSIVWNTTGNEERVKASVTDIVYNLEEGSASQASCELMGYKRDLPVQREDRSSCRAMLDAIDGLLFGHKPPCMQDSTDDLFTPRGELDALALINSIPTAGLCFVIFRTKQDKRANLCKPLPKFRGEHKIDVEPCEGDAEVVLWDGFLISDRALRWNIVKGILQVLAVIAVWSTFFWGPYTLYIMAWSESAGPSQGQAHIGMMIALLITVGNQIVYAACGMISETVGFSCRDFRDKYYTGLYTFAVLVNTVLDMWLVVIMARGWQRDMAGDPTALVRAPSMQHAMFTQLVMYLWPCTLLLPYVAEPIVLNVIPYFMAKWLVRSRPNCPRMEAEAIFELPAFDLLRYGDNLINVIMVSLFFFLTATKVWVIFLWLSVSLLFVYGWDCYRFKRATFRTHFATQEIDMLANYISAIPCAMFAGAFTFKLLGGQAMVGGWRSSEFIEDHPVVWLAVFNAIICHLFVHWMILAFIVPCWLKESPREESHTLPNHSAGDNVPYEHTAANFCCNWFNANAVHCIRSHHLYEHQPSHVFYQPGREYLHRRNDEDAEALIIYEVQEFEKDKGFLDESKTWAKSEAQWIAETIRDIKESPRRALHMTPGSEESILSQPSSHDPSSPSEPARAT